MTKAEHVSVTLGTFNFGINQDMLGDHAFVKHGPKLGRVLRKMIVTGGLDLCFGCEVGGHRQGLSARNIDLWEILHHEVGECCTEVQAGYICCWGFALGRVRTDGASQPVARIHRMHGELKRLTLGNDIILAVNHFKVTPSCGAGVSVLIVGNMHIECGKKAPKVERKVRIVEEALREMESSGSAQGAVMVLCGDCNLAEEAARRATQNLQPMGEAHIYEHVESAGGSRRQERRCPLL